MELLFVNTRKDHKLVNIPMRIWIKSVHLVKTNYEEQVWAYILNLGVEF